MDRMREVLYANDKKKPQSWQKYIWLGIGCSILLGSILYFVLYQKNTESGLTEKQTTLSTAVVKGIVWMGVGPVKNYAETDWQKILIAIEKQKVIKAKLLTFENERGQIVRSQLVVWGARSQQDLYTFISEHAPKDFDRENSFVLYSIVDPL